MDVKYVNSQGNVMDLSSFPIRIRLKASNFYESEYDVETTDLYHGCRVDAIRRKPKEYKATIDFSGAPERRAQNLEEFYVLTNIDVVNMTPGRLYVGEQYIECFVIGSSPEIYDDNYTTIGKTCTIYVPDPVWRQEAVYQFEKPGPWKSLWLNYPHEYPYNYRGRPNGTSSFDNTHHVACDFKLTVHGPCVNPQIEINGHLYQVSTTLKAGEKLIVESNTKRVYRITKDGTRVNEFSKRGDDVFRQIAAGHQQVKWDWSFYFEIVLYQERGELKWI